MMSVHRLSLGGRLALLALVIPFLTACGDEKPAAGFQFPPSAVTVERVTPTSVDVKVEYAGRVRGSREVEVRARAGGILEERLYVEGQMVEEGEALFRIDSEPYEIALRRQQAELSNAQANLESANREWRRISDLFARNAVSERERDQAQTARELAQAQVTVAQAAVADAQLNLRYTHVAAPISGVTGMESVPEGSLIQQGTLLTTITQNHPAHVHFALPETDAAARQLARSAMTGEERNHSYHARLMLPGGQVYEQSGAVDFTNSSIDPRTGTVTARAVFPNGDHQLVPGQFVRIQLVLQHLDNVFLIPPSAVADTRSGSQVFVIDDEQLAQVRVVELGPVVDGRQVILRGLEAGDRLVVNGHVALRPGAPVAVQNGE